MGLFGEKCEFCRKNKTKRKNELGQYICADCELEQKADSEEKRKCPVDGTQMEKEIIEDIIIDRCPSCKGVFLDAGEIDYLRELFGDSDSSSGFATGLAVGIAAS